jgi:hypothetical protein
MDHIFGALSEHIFHDYEFNLAKGLGLMTKLERTSA